MKEGAEMFGEIVAASTTVTLTLAVGFMFVLALVLLVPWIIDLVKSESRAPAGEAPKGTPGLSRATMALAVLVVVAFALTYILVANPFPANGSKIVGDIVVALTTTLAAITAFYFGGKTKEEAAGVASEKSESSLPTITVTKPVEGHAYHLNQHVDADFFATGKFARLETEPKLVNNAIDTSAIGHRALTIRARDCTGHDLGARTVEYEVVA